LDRLIRDRTGRRARLSEEQAQTQFHVLFHVGCSVGITPDTFFTSALNMKR